MVRNAAIVLACAIVSMSVEQPVWRDPSPHRVRFVTVDTSVRVEVLDWGGTGPPIVFVPCYVTGHAFDDMAPKLTDRFHVYAFTRRGIGASDRPSDGYDLQRSADDLLEVIDRLQMRKPILIANSCGGWTSTKLAVQHGDRIGALVYLEAADDPMLTLADYTLPPFDEKSLPPRAERLAYDFSSVDGYRRTLRARAGVAFPEAQVRYMFTVKPDGSLGPELLSPTVRRAITSGNRSTPEFGRVRVPVLALFRTPPPFEVSARAYVIQTDAQRAAVRQSVEIERLMTERWENDLRAAIPTAKIVELPGASLYMFLSHEPEVIREIRAFAATPR